MNYYITKIRRILKSIVTASAVIFITGCAATNYSKGHRALENEDYDTALYYLKSAVKEDVSNTNAVRDIGIALYYQGRVKLSSRFLAKALTRNQNDPLTLYYLGISYEQLEDFQKAIGVYQRYTQISPLNTLRKTIEGRLVYLLRKQMQNEVKATLANEQLIDPESIPEKSIAVLNFNIVSGKDELGPLSKGLTDMLITDLSQSHELKVVERARLQTLMEEMALGQSGIVDSSTAPRIGKLLGAAKLVQGTMLNLVTTSLRIDAGISSTQSAQVIGSDNVSGDLMSFLRLEKDLAFRLFDLLGVRLLTAEREAVQKLPTDNMIAFMQYCRGLDYEDRGMVREAQNAFSSAVRVDPNFAQAQTAMNRAVALSQVRPNVPRVRPKHVLRQSLPKGVPPPKGPAQHMGGQRHPLASGPQPGPGLTQQIIPNTGERLFQTAQNVSAGFVPGIESRKPTTEENNPTFGNSVPIYIRIPLPRKP